MLRIKRVLDISYKKLTQLDWDNVLIMGGDEGTGKSTLMLHIFEYWYKRLKEDGHIKKLDPDDLIKFIALSMPQFLKGLKDLSRFYLMAYDEAGELSSLRMTNKFNYAVSKTYEVVRGENLFSILIVPDVFYINSFFSSRRARGYIHVYKRGKFAYWSKEALRNMIQINAAFRRKTPWRSPPLFYDTFPKYKGFMMDHYQAKKREKMEMIREELYHKLIQVEEEKQDLLKWIYTATTLRGQKLTTGLIGQIFDLSVRSIYNKKDEYIEMQKKEGITVHDATIK